MSCIRHGTEDVLRFLDNPDFDLEKERGRFEKRWNLQLRDTAVLDDFELQFKMKIYFQRLRELLSSLIL
jgi:hypothetical protein